MDIGDAILDETLRSLYEAVSFTAGRRPDVARLRALHDPRAVLVHAEPEGATTLTVDEFARRLDAQAGDPLLAFEEREIEREVWRQGAIAHVISRYEATASVKGAGGPQVTQGVNSIQLRWAQPEWRIVSLLWTTTPATN